MSTSSTFLRFWFVHFYVQAILAPFLTLYTLITGKSSAYYLVRHICSFHRVLFFRTKSSDKLVPGCVYLCNHRSWADFFIDQTLCGGAAYLSRQMVILGTPMTSLWAWLSHSTWFFNRKPGIDRLKFAQWIDSHWQQRPLNGLIVYPEGTRNNSDQPLELKTGVLQYAFIFKRPVQIVITTNKENVVNEKNFEINYDVKCLTHISKVIRSEDFNDFDEFKLRVRNEFVKAWNAAYNCQEGNKLGSYVDMAQVGMKYEPPFGIAQNAETLEFQPVGLQNRIWLVRTIIIALLFGMFKDKIQLEVPHLIAALSKQS